MRKPPTKPKWRWVNVRLSAEYAMGGSVNLGTVRGYTASHVAGLAVTRGVGIYTGKFAITHRPSGWKIPNVAFKTRREACRAAEQFASLGDWNRPKSALYADTKLRAKTLKLADEINLAALAASPAEEGSR